MVYTDTIRRAGETYITTDQLLGYQVPDLNCTLTKRPRSSSFSFSSVFLSLGDSFLGGGDGSFNNGRLTLVVVVISSCGLVDRGTELVPRVSVVWREGSRFRRWNEARLLCWINGTRRLWDQLPNSTRVGVGVISDLYLGWPSFSGGLRTL